jgi:hypothetical protein
MAWHGELHPLDMVKHGNVRVLPWPVVTRCGLVQAQLEREAEVKAAELAAAQAMAENERAQKEVCAAVNTQPQDVGHGRQYLGSSRNRRVV